MASRRYWASAGTAPQVRGHDFLIEVAVDEPLTIPYASISRSRSSCDRRAARVQPALLLRLEKLGKQDSGALEKEGVITPW